MKILNKFSIFCLILLMTVSFSHAAFAAKALSVGTASVTNTAGDTDPARIATLDITLKGGANNVNGLVFTLNYDPAVFTFEGLEKGGMNIDDGSTYDSNNPPSAETIASTLYYQVNDRPTEGIVMIAAAAANFFTTSETVDFVAFRAKFKVKAGIGTGKYPIGIQKTIIGPDTAANAGYDQPTALAVAAGLDPNNDPTTAQTYLVGFLPGLITVTGGYDVTGTVVYGSELGANADGAVANLIQVQTTGEFKVASQVVNEGKYTFAKAPKGSYKVEILSTRPGYQKRFVTGAFVVDAAKTVDQIILAQYEAQSGKVTLNGQSLPGLRVEIRDMADGKVIGIVSVDEDGNYVTPPLPTSGTYKMYAVYGTESDEITSSDHEWTLALGTVSGVIDDLCDGQVVELFIRSETAKLQKAVMVTGAAEGADAYTLSNLLPGTDYILSMVGEGVGPVYYNDTDDFSSATPVAVTAGQDTGNQDFTFVCGDLVTISGTVTVDGSAVSGATVKANNFDFTNYKFGSAVTAADGSFEIKVAQSDDYYVFFTHDGQNYCYSAGVSGPVAVTQRTDATLVDVTSSSAVDIDIPVEITAADTAKLEGYVTLNRSVDNGGIPLENYLVGLFTTDNVPLPFVTRTDKDGYYLFKNMAPGTYNVGLLPPPPYARQFVEGVVLANDTTATADFIVDQNYKITGLVMDADVADTPVAGARVDIVKSDGAILRSATYTSDTGAYTLVDIPSGVYTLIASHKDYFPKFQEETVLADLTAITILMTKGALIEGVVSDADGVVAGAIVTLAGQTPAGQTYVKSVKTDNSGNYQFRGLAASTDHIIKAAKGTLYTPYPVDIVTTGLAGSTVTHDMTLTKPVTAWTFSGTVTEGVSPVANAYVLLFSTTTKYQKVVQTNTSGEFSFSNVIEGTDYSLLVLPGDGKPEILKKSVSITADKSGYSVEVPTIATISGIITLSEADAAAIVIAGAYDDATGVVHEVKAQNPSGDNKIFTYTIKVNTVVAYKVFAQDLTGTFQMGYYVDGVTSGAYADAVPVTNTTANVDITLNKN